MRRLHCECRKGAKCDPCLTKDKQPLVSAAPPSPCVGTEVRPCDCNHNKGFCHCSDSDCDWEPDPFHCTCKAGEVQDDTEFWENGWTEIPSGCTCTYGAYAKIGGGTGFGLAHPDPDCPVHWVGLRA